MLRYQNQIAYRGNKKLITRGNIQFEISKELHISQPTISRDMHYIQKEIDKNEKDYGKRLFEV